MKIEKKKLADSLKKLGLFVSKNGILPPMVHFVNVAGKVTMFATDKQNAARVYFDTEEQENMDFCLNFEQLVQATKIRNKDIMVELFKDRQNENGEKISGVEFKDEKTKFVFAIKDGSELADMEKACTAPTENAIVLKASVLQDAIRRAGFARNEKDTNKGMNGVNFTNDEKNVITFVSTDRSRIAVCRQPNGLEIETAFVTGIMSPKTIASIGCFEEDADINLFVTDTSFILISKAFESYSPKINSTFPDTSKFFATGVEQAYKVSPKDVLESIDIVKDKSSKDMCMEFFGDRIHIFTKVDSSTILEDNVICERIAGTEDKKVWVNPFLFEEIFKNFADTKEDFFIQFRKDVPAIAYECGVYHGMIAPRCK